jgi:hypothetical protein
VNRIAVRADRSKWNLNELFWAEDSRHHAGLRGRAVTARLSNCPTHERPALSLPRDRPLRQSDAMLVVTHVDLISVDPEAIGPLVVPVARERVRPVGLVPAKQLNVIRTEYVAEDLSST